MLPRIINRLPFARTHLCGSGFGFSSMLVAFEVEGADLFLCRLLLPLPLDVPAGVIMNVRGAPRLRLAMTFVTFVSIMNGD